MELTFVDDIVNEHRGTPGALLAMLTGIQDHCGYLPREALERLAAATDQPLVNIYGIATFYRAFSLRPRGQHLVSVCLGTACHVRGAQRVVEEFSRQLGIAPGATTEDMEFSLETVNCLGACALGPTVVVDGTYFRHVTTADVRHIIDQARNGFRRSGPDGADAEFSLEVRCPMCHHSLMASAELIEGRPAIGLTVAHNGREGRLGLSSLYGSTETRCTVSIPQRAVTRLSCPHCGEPLPDGPDCPECDAPMAAVAVDTQAVLHLCRRCGCPGHRLDLATAE